MNAGRGRPFHNKSFLIGNPPLEVIRPIHAINLK